MVLGRKATQVKHHSKHIISRVHAPNMTVSLLILTLTIWLRQHVSTFSAVKLFFPAPLSMLDCSEGSQYAQSILQEWGVCSTSLRMDIFTSIIWYSFTQENCLFFPICYLFSHLFMSEWTHRYLFYTLDYNPILLYFPFQVVPALAIEKSLRCVFLCHILIISFSFFLTISFLKALFTCWDYKILQAHFIYSLPQPQNQPFLQETWFLLLKNGIRNQDLVLSLFIATNRVFQALLPNRQEVHIYTYLETLLCVSTCGLY